MSNDNLVPKDLSKRPDHIELSRLGGQSRSPSKVLASRINGLMTSDKLTDEQKYMLGLLKNKYFVDVIIELISMNIEEIHQPARRDKIIEQLSKFLPSRSINLEVMSDQRSFQSEYEKFKQAVLDVCPDKMEEIILKMEFGSND